MKHTILIPANRARGLAVGDIVYCRPHGLCSVEAITGRIGVMPWLEPHVVAEVETLPALRLTLPGKGVVARRSGSRRRVLAKVVGCRAWATSGQS